MLIQEMTDAECSDFLTHAGIGRLGCVQDGRPYVVPVYFVYEPGYLYGFSTFGQKVQWMRANPQVCVEIDEIRNHFRWETVIVTGRYEELTERPEHRERIERARRLLERRFLWWQTAYAAMQLRNNGSRNPPLFYCIRIERITGRRATPDLTEVRAGFENAH
jgi:nitroimidazol reductase NimA-like FMN-containing flavoprotein (pyridoxamine 5'-phosphate oxidase superfamily)